MNKNDFFNDTGINPPATATHRRDVAGNVSTTTPTRRFFRALFLIAFALAASLPAKAQTYPDNEILLMFDQGNTTIERFEWISASGWDELDGNGSYKFNTLSYHEVTDSKGKSSQVRKLVVPKESKYYGELFGLSFEQSYGPHGGSNVYPYVVFKTEAARDAFVQGHADKLPWDAINKDDIHTDDGGFQIAPGKFRDPSAPSQLELYTKRFFNRDFNPWSSDGYYMVMGKYNYNIRAVNTSVKLDKRFGLTEDGSAFLAEGYGDGYNRILVTYTNTAPYPVWIEACQPQ